MIDVTYKCGIAEYREALSSQLRLRTGGYFSAICGLLLLAWAIYLAQSTGMSVPVGMLLSGAVLLICTLPFRMLQRLWIDRDFRKHPNFGLRCHMTASSEGIQLEDDAGRMESKWTAFTKFQETPNLFILFRGARLMSIFPKSALYGQQLSEFRDLLNTNIRPKA